MRAIAKPDCAFCGGRGGLLGADPLPLPEEFCECVQWEYDPPAIQAGPLVTPCARCNEPFTAFLPDNGGYVEGEGLCGKCYVSDAFAPAEVDATVSGAAGLAWA